MKDLVISGSTYGGVAQVFFNTADGKTATYVDVDSTKNKRMNAGVSFAAGRAGAFFTAPIKALEMSASMMEG